MDSHTLSFIHKPNESGVSRSLYLKYNLEKGFPRSAYDSWATDADNFDALSGVEYSYQSRTNRDRRAFVRRDTSAASLTLENGTVGASLSGASEYDVDVLLAELRTALPVMEVGEDAQVPVTFWSLSPHGPRSVTRKIDVPTWLQIEENYTSAVRQGLRELLDDDFKPAKAGQLLLWHGEPGTGKTWALRALASEWRGWCAVHYITDPEQFFGERAHYMLEVLLAEDYSEGTNERWRLLVLEDTGELLSADAKQRAGQGLSRLLNVVDGLIGQGLRILVLVTTNEKIRNLHPAVSRPGRCAGLVEFQAFDRHEAREWLVAHGADDATVDRSYPVSDLYALINGWRQGETRNLRRVGFEGGE